MLEIYLKVDYLISIEDLKKKNSIKGKLCKKDIEFGILLDLAPPTDCKCNITVINTNPKSL